ncbi:hypothetical protein Btru_025189 [Bulinus truncatus]|nr:hypothetical protein Btru_025189 [Bulinus truncatus]
MARYEAANSIIGNINFKKALFQSPSPVPESSKAAAGPESVPSMSLIYKIQLEQDIDMNLFFIKKDLHLQRLKELREWSNKLQDDNWIRTSREVAHQKYLASTQTLLFTTRIHVELNSFQQCHLFALCQISLSLFISLKGPFFRIFVGVGRF